MAYAAGAMPTIHDEQISANIFAGHFGTEIALLTEAGERSRSLTGEEEMVGVHARACFTPPRMRLYLVRSFMQQVLY